MKKFFLYLFLIASISAYVTQQQKRSEGSVFSDAVKIISNSAVYRAVMTRFNPGGAAPSGTEAVDRVEEIGVSEVPQETAPAPMPVEYGPALRFQGVMRKEGVLFAIINDDLYKTNDFFRDFRIVEIRQSYIILQGRTRTFRYNLG